MKPLKVLTEKAMKFSDKSISVRAPSILAPLHIVLDDGEELEFAAENFDPGEVKE